jgi:hypothetical protein
MKTTWGQDYRFTGEHVFTKPLHVLDPVTQAEDIIMRTGVMPWCIQPKKHKRFYFMAGT